MLSYISIIYVKMVIGLTAFNHSAPPDVHKLEFDTAYNQFYLEDRGFRGNTGCADFWNEQAFNDKLALADGVLGVGTGSYGHIKAELSLIDKPSIIENLDSYDHVVEGSLIVKSGFIEITDCPVGEVKLKLKANPGSYRVRIYSIDLAKADKDLYDGHDSYKIEIWPAAYTERKVLKRYNH